MARFKAAVKELLEDRDKWWAHAFDLFIQILIVLSLVCFSIETLPDLSAESRAQLALIELITVIIFTAEYLGRLWVADRKLSFVFSFYGLIDLLAILPFYVSRAIDLRSVRVFRLFRLLRALKIFRYSKAMQRFGRAFLLIKHELLIFLIATIFLLYVSAVGIYYFENPAQPDKFKSIFHSLWWAVATLTTVGYGDVYPITIGGRIFTFGMLMVGLGIIAVPTGLIASAMTDTINKEEREEADEERRAARAKAEATKVKEADVEKDPPG